MIMARLITVSMHVDCDTPVDHRVHTVDSVPESAFAVVMIGDQGEHVDVLVTEPAELDRLAVVLAEAPRELAAALPEQVA